MLSKKNIKDIEIKGKKIIIRVDFNVPLDKERNIIDDTRIKETLPTINYVIEKGGSLILISHLGRPDGKKEEKYSLKPVAKRLSELLRKEVLFANDCIGKEVEEKVKNIKSGDVLLLENLRFYKEEEENDDEFSRKLASFGDIFVNDAFGTCHRAHSSTVGITKYLPSVAGFLVEKEINFLYNILEKPERPFLAILGGAKVSDKIKVIDRLLDVVDMIAIGGGMANTFLKALGKEIGTSLAEVDRINDATQAIKKAENKKIKLLLPVDVLIAKDLKSETETKVVLANEVPKDYKIVDIGEETIKGIKEMILKSKTVFWNGPLGVFEIEKFAKATYEIALTLGTSSCISIVGGGDSISAIKKFNLQSKISHLSTGGGASLEFIEKKTLPALEALQDK